MKIGAFIGDICQKYQSIIIDSLSKAVREKGDTLYVFSCFATPGQNILHAEGEKSIIYLPDLKDFDGIICAGDTWNQFGMEQDLLECIATNATCPVVSLRSLQEDYYNILVDNEYSMYTMTNHFIQQGKTNICFVTGRMEMVDAQERFTGFKKAMEEAGLEVEEEDVYEGDYWRRKGEKIVDAFFEKRSRKPEVIICSNDFMAISVCEELKKRGIRVPEQVWVSGFDNMQEGQMQEVSLTTVSVPFEDMAQAAVNTLHKLYHGEVVDRKQRLKTVICPRESSGCLEYKAPDNKLEYLYQVQKSRHIVKECGEMSTDFESALSEKEAIDWASLFLRGFNLENFFICLRPDTKTYDNNKDICLRHYLDENRNPVHVNIPFKENELLPAEFVSKLENRTSIFLPIHCKNEIYGYMVLQMKETDEFMMDERYEFLSLNLGNTLKKNYMYYELFEVNDIMRLYLQDPLTEILNRRGFDRKLVELHQSIKDEQTNIAMVSIDMDGLKYINDTFGHVEGDIALKKFSECLTKALMPKEFCARMGGDEFSAALIIDVPDRAELFRETLNQYIMDENKNINEDYQLDYSMGICVVKEKDSFMDCMYKADRRMYKNKKGKVHKQGGRRI